MKWNKIRISGGSGSGKTYLGRKLEKLTGIKFISLDEIAYDLSKNNRFDESNKISFEERNRLINNVLKSKRWIIDGGYYTHAKETYEQADLLIILRPSFIKRIWNTIIRFFKRIFQGKYEGLFNFISLTKYNIKSRKKWQTERCKLFEKEYANKYKCFRSADKAYNWFLKQYKNI